MDEFAPVYSTRERVLLALKITAVAAPVYIAGFYWLFPWLRSYLKTANCDQFGAFSGLELILYGVFAGMPLSIAALIWLIEGARCLQVWRLGQSPLPGEKTLRKTRYRFGNAARARPLAVFALIGLLVGVALYGIFLAERMARVAGPCAHSGRTMPTIAAHAGAQAGNIGLSRKWRKTHGGLQM